jgi:dihydropteroate synthase
MQQRAVYDDVVAEVCAELRARVEALVGAGVDPEQLVLDPGIGFAKNAEHNWALLAAVPQLLQLGRPLLIGASRKAFLGRLLADPADVPRPVLERDVASAVVAALVASRGVWAVRAHDARSSADAVRVAAALTAAGAAR